MTHPFRSILILVIFGVIVVITYRVHIRQTQIMVAEHPHSEPILIPQAQEPEEMRVEPIVVEVPTAPELMLRDAMRQLGSNNNPSSLLPVGKTGSDQQRTALVAGHRCFRGCFKALNGPFGPPKLAFKNKSSSTKAFTGRITAAGDAQRWADWKTAGAVEVDT
jgi:hypothetical protein